MWNFKVTQANLRDLIATTGLVIFLKLDSNHQFFGLCDLEIWWMTLKNNGAPFLYHIKLCASFQSHRWIQTELQSRNTKIWVKIGDFFPVWPLKLMDDFENNKAPLLYISHGLVVKSQACHTEGPEFAPGTLQGVLFPMAAHHTTLAWQWARDCGALFTT